jgi:aspartate/glutamate racemase
MLRYLFAAITTVVMATTAFAQSQLYQEAQMNLRDLGIQIEIPEDTDAAKLEQIILATEHAGMDKEATESQVKEILGKE